MKDTTRAWLVATAILLGSAECSNSDASTPVFPLPPVYQLESQYNRGIDEYLLWQSYVLQQQLLNEQMRYNRQYEQDRRNYLEQNRVRMLQEAFD